MKIYRLYSFLNLLRTSIFTSYDFIYLLLLSPLNSVPRQMVKSQRSWENCRVVTLQWDPTFEVLPFLKRQDN